MRLARFLIPTYYISEEGHPTPHTRNLVEVAFHMGSPQGRIRSLVDLHWWVPSAGLSLVEVG